MKKFEKYKKEIEKFLKQNYICYNLKIKKPSGEIEIFENKFIIQTKNAGMTCIMLDLFPQKPLKYDLFSQKNSPYILVDKEKNLFERGKCPNNFKKNNFYAIKTIDEVKKIILAEYESTKKNGELKNESIY